MVKTVPGIAMSEWFRDQKLGMVVATLQNQSGIIPKRTFCILLSADGTFMMEGVVKSNPTQVPDNLCLGVHRSLRTNEISVGFKHPPALWVARFSPITLGRLITTTSEWVQISTHTRNC